MKKSTITFLISLFVLPVFASDYIPQEVTSEVYTTEQITTTEESYQYTNHRNFNSTYCQYKDNKDYCNRNVVPHVYKLQPVTVYTGKTVTVQKHYDVYQPKVVYEKVNSYTTTQKCEYCN